jgi:co-chaperonin GroES (HSP10)
MKINLENSTVPMFPYIVTKGHVVLAYENKTSTKDGIEEPHKKLKVKMAVIVAIGSDDDYGMDPLLVIGRRVLMPSGNKQLYEIDGNDFYIVHHLEVKVIDPIYDEEYFNKTIIEQISNMPKDQRDQFLKNIEVIAFDDRVADIRKVIGA